MSSPILQFKRGVAGAAGTVPALRPGEPAFSLNNFDFFIGFDTSVSGNKFFGSHRYWEREDGTSSLKFKLVDKDGSNNIQLKTPDTISGITTYTLPVNPVNTYLLVTDGDGVLSWTNSLPSGNVLSGVTTFTDTTDNTLGDENTGSVQLDGGMGIAKNLTVKQNLYVGGYSEFVGVVTFRGGTINIGDSNTDDINIAGEFISNLVPNTDDTYDIGDGLNSKRWRHASFSGVGTFATGAVADNVQLGISGASEIDTSSGVLTLDSAAGQVVIDDDLSVVGVSTFTGAIDANGGADISGGETTLSSATVSDLTAGRVVLAGTSGSLEDSPNLTFSEGGLIVGAGGINITGVSTFSTNLVVGGDVRINGNTIQASDGNTNITLNSNTLTTFAGDIRVNGNDIQASDGNVNITMNSNQLTTIAGDLRVNGNDIQSSSGATAITLSGNDVIVADDLTVTGNLFVSGNTTQVNTATLSVEDRTIDLGVVNGSVPASNTTWDLGVLFNYYTSGSAKKSAVIWEHADSRFKFASVIGADTEGTDNNTPQLSVTNFAPIEIGALWVNDCAGPSQVISCTGSERFLENITIDAGTF